MQANSFFQERSSIVYEESFSKAIFIQQVSSFLGLNRQGISELYNVRD